MSLGKYVTLGSLLALSGCPGDDVGNIPAKEYGRTVSPDGEVSAYVYHNDSPTGGQTQVLLDFGGCGAGSAAWHEYDIGIGLRWIDSETLEVSYPEGKAYHHNASGDLLVCFDRAVRVVMVPRRAAPSTGGEYTEPVTAGHSPAPHANLGAYTVRYDSPTGGVAQVVVEFLDVRGCADSAVTFYDSDVDLQLDWIDDATLEVRYPAGRDYDYPPWGDTVRCVTETVKVQLRPIDPDVGQL